MISDFITNTVQEDLEIVYPTPEDPTPNSRDVIICDDFLVTLVAVITE